MASDRVLSPGWTITNLTEVTLSVGGGTPSKANPSYWVDGDIPWVSPKDMKTFSIAATEDKLTGKALRLLSLVPAHSVLVVVRSGILSRTLPVALTAMSVTINQDMRAFVPEAGIDARFLAWQLIAREREILSGCSKHGTTVASIEGPALAKFPLLIAPTVEQVRIVAKLEELLSDLDAGVAELKAAQRKLAQYRQSLLKAAVEGALTAAWRQKKMAARAELVEALAPSSVHPSTSSGRTDEGETGAQLLDRSLRERRQRWEAKQLAKFKEQGKVPPKGWQAKYPEPVQPDITDLPQLPEGWVWATVDQCSLDETSITDGPFGSNLKSSHYQDAGPRVIRLQNIGDGVFIDAYAHISNAHYEQLIKHSVETNDLVVAMLGEVLPRSCIIPEGVSPAIVKADCARVRLNQDLLKPSLINALLNSKPTRDRVAGLVKGIGRPRINLGHIRYHYCPV